MRGRGLALVLIALLSPAAPAIAQTVARVKDIARVVGVRDNELYGYGVVMGLNGTGDRRQNSFFTLQSMLNLLLRQGIRVDPSRITSLDTKNVASVMVTARLPAFARKGMTLDVMVSSIGDATSLLGGTLLLTPLYAADGQVYATAAGPVSIGGAYSVTAGATGESVQKNHPTAGRVIEGAIVEREVPYATPTDRLTVALLNPDFTTASRVAETINTLEGRPMAQAADSDTVLIAVPGAFQSRLVDFVAHIEQIAVPIDSVARIVVNERTGTVIMGSHVRIATVAVSHGNLSIQIKAEFQVSQPPPFAPQGAQTVTVPKTDTTVKEEKAKLMVLPEGASIGDVVAGLNAIGATPRDLIAILQAIKQAGALQAELEIM